MLSNNVPLQPAGNGGYFHQFNRNICRLTCFAEENIPHHECFESMEKQRHVFGTCEIVKFIKMGKRTKDNAIPKQYTGSKLNVEYSVIAQSIKEAMVYFKDGVKRLLRVNNWKTISSALLSSFQLTDASGKEIDRDARENDLLKIEIPGPGLIAGDGFDWARVEAIVTKPNRVAMRVRPVANPLHPESGTAHFFNNNATSTFQVFRRGRIVTAGVYGRNEVPNTTTENAIDKVRNAAVAVGAIIVASRLQWESLVHGLLHGPVEGSV